MAALSDVCVLPTNSSNETGIYRAAGARDGLLSGSGIASGVDTLYDNFEYALARHRHQPFLGTRKGKTFEWLSFGEVAVMRDQLGAALWHLYRPKQQQQQQQKEGPQMKTRGFPVGIYSINRSEWIISEQACNAYSLVNVAIYDTFGPDAVSFIINHAQISILLVSLACLPNVLRCAKSCPSLETLICLDALPPQENLFKVLRAWAADRGVQLLGWREALQLGATHARAHLPPAADDTASVCYTSGTTGDPKGALLSHRNVMCALRCFEDCNIRITSQDVHISYLPLAHCFERAVHVTVVHHGARVGFYRGDTLQLVDDIQTLKPTVFPSVPRLWNRIYAKVSEQTLQASGLKGMLFRWAYNTKLKYLREKKSLHHPFLDRLLFNRVAAVLGGRVRLMISGSAPISSNVLDFLRVCLSAELLEGYGATETSALGSITRSGDYETGQIGYPPRCLELKLVDVPEMQYTHRDSPWPRGEVWLRGPAIFQGYLYDQAKTKEALNQGWYATGDIGCMDARGHLRIIDRKKNIFKLAQGEYVAPEKIENIYSACPLVAQIFVHGESLESELVAVVVPNVEALVAWATSREDLKLLDLNKLVQNSQVQRHILTTLQQLGQKRGLKGFEQIKSLVLEMIPFSVENGLLTPSFKLKRPSARQFYDKEIKKMYAGLKTHNENGVNAKL